MNNSKKNLSAESGVNDLEKRLTKNRRHLFVKIGAFTSIWLAKFLYRSFELLFCLILIIILVFPLGSLLLFRKLFTGSPVLAPVSRTIVGQGGSKLNIKAFNVSWQVAANLVFLFYVLRGTLGLVGASMEDFSSQPGNLENSYLYASKPGIVSLWNVRKNSNIGHEGNVTVEWEYRFTNNPISDLLLFLRAAPAYFFKSTESSREEQINLFNIQFANMSMLKAVEKIRQIIAYGGRAKSIFFVNPDCLNKTFSDSNYHKMLQNADYVFPDGIGLTIACKILRNPLEENVNGTDMLPFLCEMAAKNNYSLFLLGGQPGVSTKMAANLEKKYQVQIAGTFHGFFNHEQENNSVISAINESKADIVLVAFGAPLQEKWITDYSSQLKATVAMGVGGLFDFYSENTKRAPRWLREIGMEWVYRFLQEPGRMWKRYVVGNPLFLLRVVLWKIRHTRKT
ncbi:MAG: WecB/TagA/CpsF family glycosyltransferase [Desulfotalea sp.]